MSDRATVSFAKIAPIFGLRVLNMTLQQIPAVATLPQSVLDALYLAELANDELLCIGKLNVKQLTCCFHLIIECRLESESDAGVALIPDRLSSICNSYARVSALNRAMLDKIYSIRKFLELAQRDLAPATAFTVPKAELAYRLDAAFADLQATESAITKVEARIQVDVGTLIRIGR